jgi:catechol 2,3-dioxygenase-like lactoylglutathione lyase family enzyme
MRTKSLVAALGCLLFLTTAAAGGMPGLRGGDHLGATVPDLDEAVKFFVEVIGCEAFYKMGPFKADDDWMAVHLGVNPRAEIPQMRLIRCGHGTNLELIQYTAPDQDTRMPKNSDLGGYHFAFYVDDMEKAVAYLKGKGVKFLGEPTANTSGPSAGLTWVYFLAPWGMNLELVSAPKGMAYEKEYKSRLWNPRSPAK